MTEITGGMENVNYQMRNINYQIKWKSSMNSMWKIN